jgi:subtilisin-like proprotein convertase family protein
LDGTINGLVSHQGFALHPNVIAVAASNSKDKQSYYSNFGPELTICAPSSGSPGRGIVTTDRRGIKGYSTSDYTFSFGGTSSSTPLTAGLAALILSVNPELTSAEVKHIIMETTDKIDATNGQYVNGHSSIYGHGRINAHKAVELASGIGDDTLPETLFIEHRVNKPIPDRGEIEDSITFPLNVNVNEIDVNVEIKHTWRGDLRVSLKSPNGTEITLVNRSGGSTDDIIRSFRSSDDPSLFTNILNSTAQGDWRLKIEDMASQDVGVLVKWGLAITY